MYLCSENKGTELLCSYCAADLRLCFSIRKKRYSHDLAYIMFYYKGKHGNGALLDILNNIHVHIATINTNELHQKNTNTFVMHTIHVHIATINTNELHQKNTNTFVMHTIQYM